MSAGCNDEGASARSRAQEGASRSRLEGALEERIDYALTAHCRAGTATARLTTDQARPGSAMVSRKRNPVLPGYTVRRMVYRLGDVTWITQAVG